MIKTTIVALFALALGGCTGLTPEMIAALAKDDASICITSDIRGGAGSIVAPAGGYGQHTFTLCRSGKDKAKISVTEHGISIEHGAQD